MTYSIIGRDPGTGEIGVAVQSQAFNTGAAVPWAWAGVGAVATQSFTDRRYGSRGLELLHAGLAPERALAELRAVDELADFRQVGVMSADGRTAQWTGTNCVSDAGGAKGGDWLAQANMVASPRVWEAMGESFVSTRGALAERLLAALEAAEAEGGDWRGRGGAAIVVVPPEGARWDRVIDLRVEEGDGSLVELRRLLERALGYRAANRASEGGRAAIGVERGLPDAHVRLLRLEDAVDEGRYDDAEAIVGELERANPRWLDYLDSLARHPEMEALGRLLARREA